MNRRCFFIGTTLADNPVPHQFLTLARELAGRGHRVVVLAPHRRVDLEDPAANPGIYTWPSPRPTRLRDARFLSRLIGQYQPDCLVANFVAVNVMMVVGWWRRVPQRVAWYHTLSTQIALDDKVPGWKARLLQLRKGLAYRASTHLVPVSEAAQEDLAHLHPAQRAKCRVIHNALADPLPHLGSLPPGEALRLVCVARFNPSKGQDVLIRALALLRAKYPTLTVEFVGRGPTEAACAQLATELGVAPLCVFCGRLPHPEVLRRMATARATVLPSRSEAAGLVTIESLAVGTPLVGSRVGGIPEMVRDGVDGFLVPPDDPPALAAKLEAVLGNGALHSQLRTQARAGFLARFDLTTATPRQADWLEEIVG